jgi:hypothetical protein
MGQFNCQRTIRPDQAIQPLQNAQSGEKQCDGLQEQPVLTPKRLR